MSNKKFIAFICPLSKEGSPERQRSDEIMNDVLRPIAQKYGYSIQRADQLAGNFIMQDVIIMLRDADIVVADLTDLNPNVFYELGLRQATKGRCISIISSRTGGRFFCLRQRDTPLRVNTDSTPICSRPLTSKKLNE